MCDGLIVFLWLLASLNLIRPDKFGELYNLLLYTITIFEIPKFMDKNKWEMVKQKLNNYKIIWK